MLGGKSRLSLARLGIGLLLAEVKGLVLQSVLLKAALAKLLANTVDVGDQRAAQFVEFFVVVACPLFAFGVALVVLAVGLLVCVRVIAVPEDILQVGECGQDFSLDFFGAVVV